MNKKCKYCSELIDYSQCDDYAKAVMAVNELICNFCVDTNVLYTCSTCDKKLSQTVASTLTIYGIRIKNNKVCLDCNTQMTEKVLK